MPKFDRQKFFDGVRAFLKSEGKTLTQKRTDALEFLITQFERTNWTIPQISYAFATIYHETAHTFEPVAEYGPKSYFNKYDIDFKPAKARELGNIHPGDGYKFRGRGYVQLTGRTNYNRFMLDQNPDEAMQPAMAFKVMTEGMRSGIFTGHKLSQHISDTGKDYKNARKIINGLDKASLIAGYANRFEEILRASKTSAAVSQQSASNSYKGDPSDSETSDKQPPDFTEGERPGTNVQIDNAENVDIKPAVPLPSGKPVEVKVERVNIWTKIGLAFAGITGLGINLGNIVNNKLEEMTLPQLGYVLGGVAILGVALFLYDRAARRAHEKTLAKMATASDPAQNTVELRERK